MKLLSILALFVAVAPLSAQAITITGGKTDQMNVVVRAPITTETPPHLNAVVALSTGTTIPAQDVRPGLTDDPDVKNYLVFVLPKLKAGETITAKPSQVHYTPGPDLPRPPHFEFVEKKGEPIELVYTTLKPKEPRPVLQYFDLPHDPKDHFYTFKPFHNVYDPATGKVMLTNSAAKKTTDGLYPHHRGLFFGFNKISYGDKQTADIWHGTDNVFSQHDKMLGTEAGEVLGRQRAEISWHGKDAKTFATETREVTAYATPGGTLIDWSTVLSTTLDGVRLDGDPQHSGFHFRANMEVSKNGKTDTYYLRPDGKGKLGDTRNWDANPKAEIVKDPRTIGLPWDACSIVTEQKRYTVLRVNHPDNPGEKRGSERDYGRFGDYFEYDLTPAKPLKLKYRVWVQEGEMTVEQCNAIAAAFVSPPSAKVAGK